MRKIKILWTDDEIDLLKPHIIFLQEKGYDVATSTNGDDTLELLKKEDFNLIFLDENMPGLSGIDTLKLIKEINPGIPVVMITKSEEENIMDAAIGSEIADYIIKPVNPKQILLTIKKNIDTKRLITKRTTSDYQSEFKKISMQINSVSMFNDWIDIYRKLVYWEIELEKSNDFSINEVLQLQKAEANIEFGKYIKENYKEWFKGNSKDKPLLSPNVFKEKIFNSASFKKTVIILVDNLRYDQWKTIFPVINEYYFVEEDDLFCSILPTSTQYARNAMFAGLMPSEIEKIYPQFWVNEETEGSKNINEVHLLENQLRRFDKDIKFSYHKISNNKAGKKMLEQIDNVLSNELVFIVYNFIDMLSHANTDMEMVKELASNDSAYRSITLSWYQHSYFHDLIKKLSEKDIRLIITTDHGTVRVNHPIKVMGDKQISKNLRYKIGKNMKYNEKEVFEINKPAEVYLPMANISSKYIFATGYNFFAYPNNYNYYVNYYLNTFQHGGISLEEMLIPLITLSPR